MDLRAQLCKTCIIGHTISYSKLNNFTVKHKAACHSHFCLKLSKFNVIQLYNIINAGIRKLFISILSMYVLHFI